MISLQHIMNETVQDACEYLECGPQEIVDLAGKWASHVERFSEFDDPLDFYKNFIGDAGKANIAANILDQLRRQDIHHFVDNLVESRQKMGLRTLLDFGCGTASMVLPYCAYFDRVELLDVPNDAERFVRWRIEKHGLSHVTWTNILESHESVRPVDFAVCIDVMEHIVDSTRAFTALDQLIEPKGVLVFRAPWRSIDPHPEHLRAAEQDWFRRDGGHQVMSERYERLAEIAAGGLYQKI